MAIVLLFLTAPIQYMPNAVLSSVVFLIGVELIDLRGMRRVLRLRVDEFVVATLVAVTVVVVGVEQGIVLAIVASIIDHMRRSYRPATAVCSPARTAAGTASPADPDTRSEPGLVVYRFAGSIYYANANLFFEQVSTFATGADPPSLDLPRRSRRSPTSTTAGVRRSGSSTASSSEHGIKLVVAEPTRRGPGAARPLRADRALRCRSIYPTVEAAVAAHRAPRPT